MTRVRSKKNRNSPSTYQEITAPSSTEELASSELNKKVQALLKCARNAQDTFEFQLALQFYQKAIALSPQETELLDETADLLLQIDRREEARNLLKQSIALKPEHGASKWLYMAQLSEGEESLNLYMEGLKLLRRDIDLNAKHNKSLELRRQYCACCCAVAELFMTDLCYASDAEEQCRKVLENALQFDHGGPEVYQSMASFQLSLGLCKEAIPLAKEAARRILNKEDDHEDVDLNLADYGSKINTAKVLIECGEMDNSCYEDALNIIIELEGEDDEDIETLYLMGTVLFKLDPPDLKQARYTLERALQILNKQREFQSSEQENFEIDIDTVDLQASMISEQLVRITEAEGGQMCSDRNGSDCVDEMDAS